MSDELHPAPDRDKVASREIAMALVGGPLAWIIQLCGGFAAMTMACFEGGERTVWPIVGEGAVILLSLITFCVALAATWLSWRLYVRTREETEGDHAHLVEIGAGRTRFLALWGLVLGAGFTVTIVFNALALLLVPTCAG